MKHLHLLRSSVTLALLVATNIQAQVTLDGSLGPAGPLSGPDYVIPPDVGRQYGRNLFHSFGVFNVNSSESATFTGPYEVQNIIGRVTGGSSSTIDGLLRSNIPGADLFLVNPAGMIFGPNAKLDVQGSFHATTADFIRLEDGARFNAQPSPQDSVLTSAPPEAFGFLGENPAGITIQGELEVPEQKTLSVIGGDIKINNGVLRAPGGRINLASVDSSGIVTPHDDGLDVDSFARFGDIDISRDAYRNETTVDGGEIYIRSGQFLMDSAKVEANNTVGGKIDMKVDTLELTGGAQVDGNNRGNVTVVADTISLSGGSEGFRTQIHAGSDYGDPANQGGGTVRIRTKNLAMSDGAAISSDSSGGGAGTVEVNAENISLTGSWRDETRGLTQVTGIFATTANDENAGVVQIRTQSLEVRDGARISTSTSGVGDGGIIDVLAEEITLAGRGIDAKGNTLSAGIFSSSHSDTPVPSGKAGQIRIQTRNLEMRDGARISADTSGFGSAGNIAISASSLEMKEGAQISASTFGSGNGGSLLVNADRVFLSGGGSDSDISTGIFTQAAPESAGQAGDLTITANSLEVQDGAFIDASTFGAGDGGDLQVSATDITLRDGGTISAVSRGTQAGKSGNINISATDTLRLVDGSRITVQTDQADAGSIDLKVGRLVHLRKNSSITTSVAGGKGDGGNITIDPTFVVLDGASQIVAQAREGSGGNIRIVTDSFFQSPDSRISASSELGIDGTVEIKSPDVDVAGDLAALPATFLDVSALLKQRCAGGRSANNVNSFVVLGRSGISAAPDDLQPSPLMEEALLSHMDQPIPATNTNDPARSFGETTLLLDCGTMKIHPL